jgi:hypothetical protein
MILTIAIITDDKKAEAKVNHNGKSNQVENTTSVPRLNHRKNTLHNVNNGNNNHKNLIFNLLK